MTPTEALAAIISVSHFTQGLYGELAKQPDSREPGLHLETHGFASLWANRFSNHRQNGLRLFTERALAIGGSWRREDGASPLPANVIRARMLGG